MSLWRDLIEGPVSIQLRVTIDEKRQNARRKTKFVPLRVGLLQYEAPFHKSRRRKLWRRSWQIVPNQLDCCSFPHDADNFADNLSSPRPHYSLQELCRFNSSSAQSMINNERSGPCRDANMEDEDPQTPPLALIVGTPWGRKSGHRLVCGATNLISGTYM